jgi:Calx-beta domain-containing protein
VPITGDATAEPTQTFTVGLSGATKASIAKAAATITIYDDDSGPPVLMPGVGRVYEGASGTRVLRIPFELSRPASANVTATWSTANNSATAGSDYNAASGALSIPAGTTRTAVDVVVRGDTTDENDEVFAVNVAGLTNATLGGYRTGFGLIVDDDGPAGSPQLVGGVGTAIEGDSGTTNLVVPVTLSGPSTGVVTATWVASDSGAIAPNDYAAVTGTLRFEPGQTSKTVTVPVVGDTVDEVDEVFTVAFSNVTGASLGGFGFGFGKIVDDDGPPGGPDLLPQTAQATEGDSGTHAFSVPVRLSGATASTVTANWTTIDAGAQAPNDYRSASGTVTFVPGTTTANLVVTIVGDTVDEPDEGFRVVFSSVTNAGLGSPSTGTVTILDDDP